MWGTGIVGFGSRHYMYESGLTYGFDRHPSLMKKLGRHRAGRACLYIRRLADVDLEVLKTLIAVSVEHARPADA